LNTVAHVAVRHRRCLAVPRIGGRVTGVSKLDNLPVETVTVVLVTASRTLAALNAKEVPLANPVAPSIWAEDAFPLPVNPPKNGVQLVKGGTADCIDAASTTPSTGYHGRGPGGAIAKQLLASCDRRRTGRQS
jgi:hypothetical protein